MRRIIITAVIAVAALAGVGAVAVATGNGSTVTRARLERALPIAFANQYAEQAKLLGHSGVTPESLHAVAMCDKHGPDVADVGPGADWICLMGWTDPNVPMPPEGYGKFELNVHSNDCYTAGGPSKLVGFQMLTDKSGAEVNNPVFEFDGCFDPNTDNTPTGTTYPSVLNVASTILPVDASGKVGAQGCAGTISAASGSVSLGTISYRLKEEATATLRVPTAVPADAKDVTFTFTPTAGMAPPSAATIALQR
ncbi:MAG: hypothetical protein JF565_01560 [Propionibacteriales bacterium]|nr:hypothetical protein [Propionibacteriales bacterium]